MQSLLGAHSFVTPVDIILGAISFLAVGIAFVRSRGRPPSDPRRQQGWPRYVIIWIQYFFGVHALFSGPNYFLHIYPQIEMAHPLAGPLQHYLELTGLFSVVKVIETITGICLVLDIFVPFVLILEMPVSFNIFYLSVFVVADPRTMWTGPRELLFNLILLAAYGGYFLPIFKPRVELNPLWAVRRTGQQKVSS